MAERALNVSEVAERYAVDPHAVLGWIRSGELSAINCGRAPNKKKPRWRVTPEQLAAFELRRLSSPPPAPPRRRKQSTPNVIEFYR
jgi:hypothetical protein